MEDHPCLHRIDEECFKAHPAWAKQAFAYRLLYLFCPKVLTKRLPKGLRRALIAPGVVVPPGVEVPGGFILGPGAELPTDWVPWGLPSELEIAAEVLPLDDEVAPVDEMPPGVAAPPVLPLDDEAVAVDEMPPGVAAPPVLPLDDEAAAVDEMPPGVAAPPVLPHWIWQTGLLQPLYVAPWEPGPPRPTAASIIGEKSATIYADSSDGYVRNTVGLWVACRGATSGNVLADDVTYEPHAISAERTATWSYRITRSFFSFDLSDLTGKTVESVSFRLCMDTYKESSVSVQEGEQHDPLVKADYSAYVDGLFVHKDWDTSVNSLDFNALGITYIQGKLGGTAKLCCREYDHDHEDVDPPTVSHYRNGCRYSTYADDDYKPHLIINY